MYSEISSNLLRAAGKPQLDPALPVSEDQASPIRARGVGASEERSPHGPPHIMAATQAPIINQILLDNGGFN